MLDLSPVSSAVRTERSNTTGRSVLISALAVMVLCSPLQRSLECWAVEGTGGAGSGSQWIRCRSRLPGRFFQSLDWLCDPTVGRMNCTPVIHMRSMAKKSFGHTSPLTLPHNINMLCVWSFDKYFEILLHAKGYPSVTKLKL